MPYTITKRDCKQTDGTSGSWVKSYVVRKGKNKGDRRSSCHTSKEKAQASIAAAEMKEVAADAILSYLPPMEGQVDEEEDQIREAARQMRSLAARMNLETPEEQDMKRRKLQEKAGALALPPLTDRDKLATVNDYTNSAMEKMTAAVTDLQEAGQEVGGGYIGLTSALVGMSSDLATFIKKYRKLMDVVKAGDNAAAAVQVKSLSGTRYAESTKRTGQTMDNTTKLLRRLVMEVMEEIEEEADGAAKKGKKKDVTGDGEADFDDVMASRMMASGMPKSAAVKKAEKVTAKYKKK